LKAINNIGYAYLPTVLLKRSQTSAEAYRGSGLSSSVWACDVGTETPASAFHSALAICLSNQEVKHPKQS